VFAHPGTMPSTRSLPEQAARSAANVDTATMRIMMPAPQRDARAMRTNLDGFAVRRHRGGIPGSRASCSSRRMLTLSDPDGPLRSGARCALRCLRARNVFIFHAGDVLPGGACGMPSRRRPTGRPQLPRLAPARRWQRTRLAFALSCLRSRSCVTHASERGSARSSTHAARS
jgi:hypothetical protein